MYGRFRPDRSFSDACTHLHLSCGFLAERDVVAGGSDVSAGDRASAGDLLGDGAGCGAAHPDDSGEDAVTRLRRDESGTALILAIGFMVVIGLIGAAMLSSVSSGLASRVALDQARTREYAADSAIQDAITRVSSYSSFGLWISNTCSVAGGELCSCRWGAVSNLPTEMYVQY